MKTRVKLMPGENALSLGDLEGVVLGSARGRKAKALEMSITRELNSGDLELLRNPPAFGTGTPQIKTLRNTHHMLAKLLAEGKSGAEASLITGYSPSRISILRQDPTFKELEAYYKSQVAQAFVDVQQRLASLGISCLEELQERLDAAPDDFSKRELMDLAELCLDRSAFVSAGKPGNQGATININFVRPKPRPEGPVIDQNGTTLEIEP